MPTFRVLDAHGDSVTIELPASRLEAKGGVLEALAADDAENEIRLDDVGLGALSAAEFGRAVDAAYAPLAWEELERVAALHGDARGALVLDAVEWLGVHSATDLARSTRATAEPSASRLGVERVQGWIQAQSADPATSPLRPLFLSNPPGSLFGVLVGGSLVLRARRGEALQWTVDAAATGGDMDSLRFLHHLRITARLPVQFHTVLLERRPAEEGIRHDEGAGGSPTPFVLAAAQGHVVVLEFLWSVRESSESADWAAIGTRAFQEAAGSGHRPVLEFLWDLRETHGVAMDPTDLNSQALIMAACNGHIDVLEFLWTLRETHGVAMDPAGRQYEAFVSAAQNGHVAVLRFFHAKAETHRAALPPANRINQAFIHAAGRGHLGVLQLLWELRETHGVAFDPAAEGSRAFTAAAREGHVEVLRFLWRLRTEFGVEMSASSMSNQAFLGAAAAGHVEVLRFLNQLRREGDKAVNPAARWCQALVDAAAHGHLDVLRFLWELVDREGLGIDLFAQHGAAFVTAAGREDTRTLELLWARAEERGYTPQASPYATLMLDAALRLGRDASVRFLWHLHTRGALTLDADRLNRDALQRALVRGHVNLARCLWDLMEERGVPCGARVASPEEKGPGLFERVANFGHLASLEFLWELHRMHGIDVDPKGTWYARVIDDPRRLYPALVRAAARGDEPILRFLHQLHRDGLVTITEAEQEGAMATANLIRRRAVHTILVPDAVDAEPALSDLNTDALQSASAGTVLEALDRIHTVVANPLARESVTRWVGFVALFVSHEDRTVRDGAWEVLSVFLRWNARALPLRGNAELFQALVPRLASEPLEERVEALELLCSMHRSHPGLPRASWLDEFGPLLKAQIVTQCWGLLKDPRPALHRRAVVLVADLKLPTPDYPDSERAAVIRILLSVLEHGSVEEQCAALTNLQRHDTPKRALGVDGLPTVLVRVVRALRREEDLGTSRASAAASLAVEFLEGMVDAIAEEATVVSDSIVREFAAVIACELDPTPSLDERTWAAPVFCNLARKEGVGARLLACPGVIEAMTEIVDALPVASRWYGPCGVHFTAHLAEPSQRPWVLSTPRVLRVLVTKALTLGSVVVTRYRAAVEAILLGAPLDRERDPLLDAATTPPASVVESVAGMLVWVLEGSSEPKEIDWPLRMFEALLAVPAHRAALLVGDQHSLLPNLVRIVRSSAGATQSYALGALHHAVAEPSPLVCDPGVLDVGLDLLDDPILRSTALSLLTRLCTHNPDARARLRDRGAVGRVEALGLGEAVRPLMDALVADDASATDAVRA